MVRLLPTKQELKDKALPYILAVVCTGFLLSNSGTGVQVSKESVEYITVTEVKEVVKYVEVERKDKRRTEITRPDGTRIVSTHDSKVEKYTAEKGTMAKESQYKEETKEERKVARAQYNLGLFVDSGGDVGVSLGARLGELPLTLQLYTVPARLYGAVGLSLEF